MTETVESVIREVADGLPVPQPGDSSYELIEGLAKAITELRNDASITKYKRQQEVHALRCHIHRCIVGEHFEGTTPHRLHKWYPEGSSEAGFLGWGESLEAIQTEDAATLAELDLSAKSLGMKLREVLDSEGSGGFSIEKERWFGGQKCPFDSCHESIRFPHSDIDFTLVNILTGEGIVGPGLIWHLIAEHGFFEGKYSEYRVDPRQLARVLFG